MPDYIKGQQTGGDVPEQTPVITTVVVDTVTLVHAPAAATKATVTVAAGAVRHVCSGITASIGCGITAQTPININLIDGVSGGATLLWSGVAAAAVNNACWYELTGLSIHGSLNTAMTLEFAAAGVAASVEAVVLHYYDEFEK